MYIRVMNLLLLSRASEDSFQMERENVLLPPLPAMTRAVTDDLELPAVDNPARKQDGFFAKHRKVEEDPEEQSQAITIGIQESWWEYSCNPGVLCDALQKHPLR